jgi:beta-galactosidase
LNGKSLGEKPVDKYDMLTVDVPYEAGKLEAVARNGGKEVARFAVETTGAPAALKLIADRASMAGDGADAEPVTVEAVDAAGRVVPTAKLAVTFEIAGPGGIIGLNDGDPNCHEPEKGNAHSIFNGLGQVIVQSAGGGEGALTLRAKADGLAEGDVVIEVKAAAAKPSVAPAPRPVAAARGGRRGG